MIKEYLKKRKGQIVFCTFNAFFLVIITFSWVNYSYFLSDDEEYLIKGTITSKKTVNDFFSIHREKLDSTKFLFINLSWEKQLIDVIDNTGKKIGKRPITNRKRLAKFFERLNKNPEHKFIILDVWFKDSSDYQSDSLLQAQFDKTKNFLIPYHKDSEDDFKKDSAIFRAPTALSDYEKDDFDNNFVKFRLVQGNNFKTTPLVMYEKLHHDTTLTEKNFWHYMGDHLALNSFILEQRIWNYDLEEHQKGKDSIKATYYKSQLSDFLDFELEGTDSLPSEVRENLIEDLSTNLINLATKDKIIVIGDFEDSDIHQTLYGPTPGPLILLNVFLALEAGDNLINWGFVLFLFIGYYFISYKCYTQTDFLDKYFVGKIIGKSSFKTYLMSFMSYLIYFIILSLLSYFFFYIHLTILLLAIYMEVLERIIEFWRKRKAKVTINNTTSPAVLS